MTPRCRLIAVDLDGTLLDPAGTVTPAVSAAVAAAAAAGATVVIATGRRYRSSAPIARGISACPYIIVQHGAAIKRTRDDATVHSAFLPMPRAVEVAEFLRGEGLESIIGVDGYSQGIDFYVYGGEPTQPAALGFAARSKGLWKIIREGEVPPYAGATTVFALGEEGELPARREALALRFGDELCYHVLKSPQYDYWFIEVMSTDAGKGKALLELARRLKVSRRETAAVGDDVNDLDMLAAAGTAVAMGNAVEEVKRAADMVVASNDRDGAAEAIERLLDGRL